MGAVSLKTGDGTARFHRATLYSSGLRLIMLLSVVTTNLFALYAFTYAPRPPRHENTSLLSEQVFQIVKEIEISQKRLDQIGKEVLGYDTVDISKSTVPSEMKIFLKRYPLPLGRDARTGITEMVSSVGHKCGGAAADMAALYMSYLPGSRCPEDELLAEKLLLKGCEPLPRRRCLSRRGAMQEILSLPGSLWPNQTIPENRMWLTARGRNDFLIEEVLSLAKGIRIGFDIGDGGADFAARMAEKSVTVVTSTTVSAARSVAARGLFPLQLTSGQRFPFSDSIFDLVHVENAVEDGVGDKMEFFLFDVDRVLRPGGILWLDNVRCLDQKAKGALTALIDKFEFKKLKWVVGEKVDSLTTKKIIILSAVLQKPARP